MIQDKQLVLRPATHRPMAVIVMLRIGMLIFSLLFFGYFSGLMLASKVFGA